MAEPQAPSTVTMYDASTGQPVQVGQGDVAGVLRSRRAGFTAEQKIPVVGPDGRIQEMDGAAAAQYLTSAAGLAGGAATGQQLQRQRQDDEYGGLGGTALATGAGLLRGATAGLSDAALTGTGLVQSSTLRGLEEANPLASMASEGAGLLGGALVTGGESLAARGALGAGGKLALGAAKVATAPTRAIGALGGLAERGVGALVGEGMAGRALAASAGAGVEGALFGVGQAVSQSAIRDEPLTAEKLVAAAGHGALIGGAAGGALSAAGSLIRGAGGKLADGAGALARRLDATEARVASDAVAAVPTTESAIQSLAGRAEREAALKSAGADAGLLRKLDDMGPDVEARVVRMMSEGEVGAAAGREGRLLNPLEKKAGGAALREARGKEVGALVDELEAAGAKADTAAVVAQQREALTQKMLTEANPDLRRAAKEFDTWLTDVERNTADGSVKGLWKQKRTLGDEINWNGKELNRYEELKKDLYFALDREITRVGAESADKVGVEFAARWANANAEYRAADWLAKATKRGAVQETAVRRFGLSEQIAAGAGLVAGVASGGLAGVATAAAASYAAHVAKRYGADIALQLARAVRQGELVQTIERHVDQLVGSKVAGLVGAGKAALATARPVAPLTLAADKTTRREPPVKTFEARSKAVTDYLAAAPERRVAATRGLEGTGGVQQQVQQVVQRGAEFLAGKMPPRRPDPPGVPPHLLPPQRVSPDEAAKWLRYARAVDNPLGVLDDARKGTLSAESVEALKAVYPTLYGALQQQVWTALGERQKPLTWGEKLRLGTLLDLPTDPTLMPAAIQAFQAAQTQPSGGASGGKAPAASGPKTTTKPLKIGSLTTKADRIGAGV